MFGWSQKVGAELARATNNGATSAKAIGMPTDAILKSKPKSGIAVAKQKRRLPVFGVCFFLGLGWDAGVLFLGEGFN